MKDGNLEIDEQTFIYLFIGEFFLYTATFNATRNVSSCRLNMTIKNPTTKMYFSYYKNFLARFTFYYSDKMDKKKIQEKGNFIKKKDLLT